MRGGRRARRGWCADPGWGARGAQPGRCAQRKPARPVPPPRLTRAVAGVPARARTARASPGAEVPRVPSGGCQGPGDQAPRSRSPGSLTFWWCTQAWRLPKPRRTPSGPPVLSARRLRRDGPFPELNAQASFCLQCLHVVLCFPRVALLCQMSFLQT